MQYRHGLVVALCSAIAALAIFAQGPARAADAALIDAAKKEGEVTWYTTQIIDQFARPAAEAFEKKYGIKVNYVRADASDSALRILNEARAGKVQADLFDGIAAPALVKEGAVLDYVPDSSARLPPQFVDPQRYLGRHQSLCLYAGLQYRARSKGTEPKSYGICSIRSGRARWPGRRGPRQRRRRASSAS